MKRSLLLLLLPSFAHADGVDDLVVAEMRKSRTPGVAVGVFRGGKPIKMKGYGLANIEHAVPVKPETMFQSGSVGKQFTATLVMILVKEGRIGLDDEITKYIGEAKGKWDGVTVRHLLSHTSGLPDLPYSQMDLRRDYTEDDLVKLMLDSKAPRRKPGTEWRYNNGGYVMLGVLVRRATGKFYGDLLQEKIFAPLGMKTARIISEKDIVPNRASGYELEGSRIRNQRWVSPSINTTADGALYLSLIDMAKWDAALYGERLLPKAMIEQTWTPVRISPRGLVVGKREGEGYGFGWAISASRGRLLVEHGGAWQGFTAYIGRQTDRRLTVVVFTNLATGPAGKIGKAIFKAYLGKR